MFRAMLAWDIATDYGDVDGRFVRMLDLDVDAKGNRSFVLTGDVYNAVAGF